MGWVHWSALWWTEKTSVNSSFVIFLVKKLWGRWEMGERLHVKLTVTAPHLLAGILWKQRRLRLRRNHKANSSGKDLCSAGWRKQWDTASRDLTIPQQCWKLLQGVRGLLSARSGAINQSLVTRERKRTSTDLAEVTSNLCRWGSQRKTWVWKETSPYQEEGLFFFRFSDWGLSHSSLVSFWQNRLDSFVCSFICSTWFHVKAKPKWRCTAMQGQVCTASRGRCSCKTWLRPTSFLSLSFGPREAIYTKLYSKLNISLLLQHITFLFLLSPAPKTLAQLLWHVHTWGKEPFITFRRCAVHSRSALTFYCSCSEGCKSWKDA